MKIFSTFLLFLFLLRKETTASIESEILKNLFSKNDLQTKPENVTVVKVNLFVRRIEEINDDKQTIALQLSFRQQWTDERLQFKNPNVAFIKLDEPNKIWLPDTFFTNSISEGEHKIMKDNSLIRIYPDGNILYSRRIDLKLSCPMDLRYFPLDKQQCSIKIASYGHATNSIIYLWKDPDPIQISRALSFPNFVLEAFKSDYCTSLASTGEYSCLKVSFTFKRMFSHYLVQIYIPCCMLVIIAWLVFWIDASAFLSRLFLSLATLLTMTMLVQKTNDTLPKVSYTTAIDVWTGVCLTFSFYTLIECIFVHFINRNDTLNNAKTNAQADTESNAINQKQENEKNLSSNLRQWLKKIDFISLIGYPTLFAIFNICYWAKYLGGNEI